MNRIIFALIIMAALPACTKDKAAATVNDPIPENAESIRKGNFINGVHFTSGSANILQVDGQKKLVLENFTTDNGPDLKVYLANDRRASMFILVGDLKAVSGNQTYSIVGMPDLAEYPYVLIWCQQFGVLFGSAQLQ